MDRRALPTDNHASVVAGERLRRGARTSSAGRAVLLTRKHPMTQVASPPAAGKAPGTLGADLAASPALRAAIDTIIREVASRSARLTDIRAPQEGLREPYNAYLKRAADSRGRALLYPCLGSGLGNGPLVELLD